jgi:hypothetical protein
MADITMELIQDRSWYDVNASYEQVLKNLTDRLKAAGLQPGTSEYDGAFNSIVGAVSKSTIDLTDTKYSDPVTQNNALVNWMKQNFTYEMASKMGVDVNTTLYSPDFSGWTTPSGEFVKANDPWARDKFGERVLDENGNPILTPVYAFTQLYEKLYGRKPTAEEIDAGTRDIIAQEGWTAAGRTSGYPGFSLSSGSTSSTTSTGYRYNPITKQYEPISAGFGPGSAGYADRKSAYDLLYQQFSQYGLGALVEPLKNLITEGISPSEFTIRLRDTDAYKKRFAANSQRINKGLTALSEAEYLQLEDQYQNIMRNYGLPESYYTRGDMGVQQGFEKFIANDVSAAELEDRLSTAYNRVINAAPEVSKALKNFYPDITNGDILAYALDPQQALLNIKRKVTAAEIGAGALVAGLETGVSRAEQLQQYGVTGDMARQGYQTISSYLPRASTLSDIYSKQGLGQYTQTTAEQEVFGLPSSAEAATKRKKLSELESAAFSGKSGAVGGALSRDRAGSF